MLKLIALDEEDLAVFSFHLHQARLCPNQILWQAARKRFLAPLRRFDWDTALNRAKKAADRPAAAKEKTAAAAEDSAPAGAAPLAIAAILHCDRVLSVRSHGFDRADKTGMLTLKGLCFKPSAAPAGVLEFLFYEQAGLQLELECIELKLTDLAAD